MKNNSLNNVGKQFRFRTIIQYAFIILIMYLNQSSLIHARLTDLIPLLAFFGLILLFMFKKTYVYSIGFLIVLFVFCLISKFTVGQLGLSNWLTWVSMISLTTLAIVVNGKSVISKYIKIVNFFSIISLIGYALQMFVPTLMKRFAIMTYQNASTGRQWIDTTQYDTYHHITYDFVVFVINDNHMTRNSGIFSEPGVFQMVVVTALVFALFFVNNEQLSRNEVIRTAVISTLTVLTTQSTTGVLALAAVFFVFGVSKVDQKRTQRIIFLLTFIATLVIITDYLFRGQASLLFQTVISKIFEADGQLGFDGNTGSARAGTISICFQIMLRHPMGIGYQAVHDALNVEQTGYLGAQIMQTGAAMGLACFMFIITWLLYPILSCKKPFSQKVLFVFLYLNTALAQSREFYPALIIIPLYLYYSRSMNVGKEKDLTDIGQNLEERVK